MSPKLFPTILIALDVLSALVYFCKGDFRHFIYWSACAVLTATVTY